MENPHSKTILAVQINESRTRRILFSKNTRTIFTDGTINVGVCVRKNNVIPSMCVRRLSPQDTGVQIMKKLSLSVFVSFSLACCIGGCGNDCTDSDGQPQICTAILPQEPLPGGWRLIPSSKMPLSPRMYSWKKNPIIWTGAEAKEPGYEGQQVFPARFLIALYEKNGSTDNGLVAIYFQTFLTQSDAAEFYDDLRKIGPPKGCFAGYYLSVPNTVIILRCDEKESDQDFFIQYFNANSSQSPNTIKGD